MTTEEITELARRLKQCRLYRQLSYQDLAKLTGIPKSTLQRYESGFIKKVPVDNLNLIAKAMHVDAGYLMGWNDNAPDTTYYLDPETAEQAQMLKDNPDLRILLDASKHLSPADIKALIQIVNTMKGK